MKRYFNIALLGLLYGALCLAIHLLGLAKAKVEGGLKKLIDGEPPPGPPEKP